MKRFTLDFLFLAMICGASFGVAYLIVSNL